MTVLPQDPRSQSRSLSFLQRLTLGVFYVSAIIQFVRINLLVNVPYLNMTAYLSGKERLPFQRRVLLVEWLNVLNRHPFPPSYTSHHGGTFASSATIYLLLINLVAFSFAAFFCVRLHSAVAPRGRFHLLVFPIFLFAADWSYNLHVTSNWYYPWDITALAFFTAGLFALYTRRFWWLFLIVLVGTFNRETTLFLVILYAIDNFLKPTAPAGSFRDKLAFPPLATWLHTALLAGAYIGVTLFLSRLYRSNDASESFLRIRFNIHEILSEYLPQIFSACGFLLPVAWLMRLRIPNVRFANYLLIIPLYVLAMFLYGALAETRIFGELCPLVAVACVLLLEAAAEPGGCPTHAQFHHA